LVVCEASEQGLAICRPGDGHTLGLPGILADVSVGRLELVNNGLALEIEDLDAAGSGSAQPVAVGREDKSIDNITSLKRVEVLALVQIPEHGDTVLATGGSERTVGRDGDGVDVTGVAVVVGLQLELREFPDLDDLVPTARNNDRVHDVGAESDARNPLGVTLLLNVVFAFSESVPEFDGPVARTRDDLTVVGAEADGKDIGSVANKAAGGQSGVQVPETESVIPGRGEGELAIGGNDDIRNEVVVAVENTFGVS